MDHLVVCACLLAAARLRIDVERYHPVVIEALSQRFVRQVGQELVEAAHLVWSQRSDRAVSELVVLSQLLAATNQIAARLLAFPRGAGEEEMQRLPGLVEIEL